MTSTALRIADGQAHGGSSARSIARTEAAGRSPAGRLAGSRAFAGTVARYLLFVLPAATRERARWHRAALEIPDPDLRRTAILSLGKRGNIEGAALFATLVPAVRRRAAIRALVAFQSAYNYLDALSERQSADPRANAERLHQALLLALQPGTAHVDYYAYNPASDDGGFLAALVDSCREAFAELPSHALIAPTAREAAGRIVAFQALNLSEAQGGHRALRRWASETIAEGSPLSWWEVAAGAGSSLAVHALIAAAAEVRLDPGGAAHIDRAYFPSIGALHSLLDSLVDRREDRDRGQRSLLDYYRSPIDTTTHLASLAVRAREAARRLPRAHRHRVIVTAMCSYYLSAPECDPAETLTVARGLADVLGPALSVAIAMFRARRLAHTLTRRRYV